MKKALVTMLEAENAGIENDAGYDNSMIIEGSHDPRPCGLETDFMDSSHIN